MSSDMLTYMFTVCVRTLRILGFVDTYY